MSPGDDNDEVRVRRHWRSDTSTPHRTNASPVFAPTSGLLSTIMLLFHEV